MMNDSMTPPDSPYYDQGELDVDMSGDFDSPPLVSHEESEKEEVPQQTKTAVCLHCQGEVFPRRGNRFYQHVHFHDRGILKSGILDRILQTVPVPEPELTICLFGYTFPHTALRNQMEKLFNFARQTVNEIQNPAEQDMSSRLLKRQNIVTFLEYVNVFIVSSLPDNENERCKFLRLLLRQLHLFLLYAGRASDDVILTRYSLNQLDSMHHNIHHRLELAWYLLMVLHTLTTFHYAPELPLDVKWCHLPGGEEEIRSIFDQLVSILMHDLVSLAVPIFEKLSGNEWLHTSPFSCACVMEIWVLLRHLLQYRKEKFDDESFWVRLHQILQNVGRAESDDNMELEEEYDSDIFVLTIVPSPSKPLGFCLWLTTHLAHIFTFSHHGNSVNLDPSQNCLFAVQMTVEKLLKAPLKEEMLRACLRCCVSVSSLWPPPSQLITLLWDLFSKKLNDRFQLHTASIEGLAVINKSSASLLDRAKKWCSADDAGWEQDSSFHLFLRLLAKVLMQTGGASEWRQIKGRFFSKFHQRRMQELHETGLHNMTCLFLTVASCVDTEEVARKLLAWYDMVDPSSAYGRLRIQVWCGAFAMARLLAKQKLNFDFLTEKLSASFITVATQLAGSGSSMDYSYRQGLSPLIILYVDGVRDIVELSQLEGSEHLFINDGIHNVLVSCNDSEMRHILIALDSIVMRFRGVVRSHKQTLPFGREASVPGNAFAARLWTHVFPFVRDHCQTLTPPLSLADLAVSFAHLAIDFPAPANICQGGVGSVVRQFIILDSVHTSIVCHFLNQVLGDDSLRNALSMTTSETSFSTASSSTAATKTTSTGSIHRMPPSLSQTDVVKCWWRCVLLMLPSSSSLMELTQRVVNLPDVRVLMSNDGGIGDIADQGSVSWKQFLKAIGSQFSRTQSLFEKQKMRTLVMPFFGDSMQQVSAVIRAAGPLETLLNVYRVLGYLVKHCAPLLYLQSKPCPVPDIIKNLILPASVFSTDRPLQTNFVAAIRDTLPLFLEGLGRLDYRRDSFIQRQVRSIVIQFLPRFPLSLMDVYDHPVLRLIGKLPHETTLTDRDFDRFVANLVMESLKKNPTSVTSEIFNILKGRFEDP